jgi:hypothetical protein
MNRHPFRFALTLLLAASWCVSGTASAAEGEGSYTIETTASAHTSERAYFLEGAPHWSELFSRARVQMPLSNHVSLSLGGVIMTQVGKDYSGFGDRSDGRIDRFALTIDDLVFTGLDVTLGRQDFKLGDGFLLGDGYLDTRAARWNIPLSFYDGATADWAAGDAHLRGFALNYSPSYESSVGYRPDGLIVGGEVEVSPGEGKGLAVAYLQRRDKSAFEDRSRAWSVRGDWTSGAFEVNAEGVLQGGKAGGVDRAGRGGHANVIWTGEGQWEPSLRLHYTMVSGDDPTTTKDEAFDAWQPSWNDWSEHYMGDLLASTIGAWSDMRIALVELGVKPREGTGLRLLAHRFDRDQGSVKPFAYEFDAVVDHDFGKGWTGWIMGGLVKPLDRAKADFPTPAYTSNLSSTQLFASLTYKFGGTFKN